MTRHHGRLAPTGSQVCFAVTSVLRPDRRRETRHHDRMARDPAEPQSEIRRRGVIAVVLREERFLVIRRSLLVVAPGKLCFPGGGIEGDETEEQTLEREFREELGAAIRPLRRVWQNATRWHVELAWWLGEVEPAEELRPNPAEVGEVHWMTRQEMFDHVDLLESNRDFLVALAAGSIRLD
jgi:8-oxo-dGTP diphosphatase